MNNYLPRLVRGFLCEIHISGGFLFVYHKLKNPLNLFDQKIVEVLGIGGSWLTLVKLHDQISLTYRV